MPATIKDIARKLNLSVSTVSYALNGGPRPVSDEVRHKVKQAAIELDYRPNQIARSLVTRRTGNIGVALPRLEPHPLQNVFIRDTLNGLLTQAEVLGYNVLLFTGYGTEEEDSVARMLEAGVDGIVLLAPMLESMAVQQLYRRGIPTVLMSGRAQDAMPMVTVNNRLGARMALHHLWDLGHRKIAHIAGRKDHHDSDERARAFCEFMDEHQADVPTSYFVYGDFTREHATEPARALLRSKNRPTAIFASNDEMAFAVWEVAQSMGIRVPQDLSVIGFDGSELAAHYGLTTVAQPFQDMGALAMTTVFQLLEGSTDSSPKPFVPSLVIRASTSPPFNEEKQ